MNDRDRLIELINHKQDYGVTYTKSQMDDRKVYANETPNSVIADYILADGWIRLPCKVGDTVYSYCDCFGVVLPYFVETIYIGYYDKNKTVWQYEANCTNVEEDELLDSIDFEFDDIGKTVFLTKEEAERALKEREQNG